MMAESGRYVVSVPLPPHGGEGLLGLPAGPLRGVVLFAHGSGSSRHSPRNAFVAGVLEEGGFATLLFDLLTEREAEDRTNVFDIPLLCERLSDAADWVAADRSLKGMPLGLFGASTGAAAALMAAARRSDIRAVVSRGGRPDLAGDALAQVSAPTLLVVGGNDPEVLELNRAARRRMRCVCQLDVVPGATHLFEEQGTLETAAKWARDWFRRYMAAAPVEGEHAVRGPS